MKLASDEKEQNPQNPLLQEFIRKELERQKELADRLPDDRNEDWEALNQAFLKAIQVCWPRG